MGNLPGVDALRVFAPAKLNLFLAITGRRADGFHDLVSLVVPVQFGDELRLTQAGGGLYSLSCDTPGVPLDATNLVLRAAQLFAEKTDWRYGVHFELVKRVPIGAGLGGGSSDGAAALLGLNELAGFPLSKDQLGELAAQLGSDCRLFLQGGPTILRGRGERVEGVDAVTAQRLRGRRVLIFKPSFGIETAWAYRTMAQQAPRHYLPNAEAEEKLGAWLRDAAQPAESVLFNNMEGVAFEKFIALPTLLEKLRREFSYPVAMSGSGSACFLFLPENADAKPVLERIREAWGKDVFAIETRIA